ncbi:MULTISPECIES: hypothetical protein [unclassified Mesorhizobium]|uniref:hypothetical protein n=1 Tax=unclassified Mesorhizobium TaxID=325217 RepID=UPI000FD860E7|nr:MULTISPECIES: hypothetical protein [unclassified Mesorhizobium]TGT76744.1 hypothetical protein EN809_003840 [Mesorhizobium sp. M2E.F.Ca.ET.166.01.1.1]TGW02856.1 hypothetical protein EN797_003840 [Mesorhizobium sp. M2E.F.Ca.ET.154.01.1.1]
MNAIPDRLARMSGDATLAYMADTPMAAKRALDDAIAIYDNPDDIMREKALDAIAEDRAAYWSMSGYSDAIGSTLPYMLNAGVDIGSAVDQAYEHRPFLKRGALARIVPLNMAAARALSAAYARYGAWRDEPELLMRAKRDCRRK